MKPISHTNVLLCLIVVLLLVLAISTEVDAAIRFSTSRYSEYRYTGYYSPYRSYRSYVAVYRPTYVYRSSSSYRSVLDNNFRKSDYILPTGLLLRKGGLPSLRKEQLLLAGSVYVASRLRHKFSASGDGLKYSYNLNTYDDLAVCQVDMTPDAFASNFSVNRNYSYFLCPSDAIGFEFNEYDLFCCGPEIQQNCCDEEAFYRYHGAPATLVSGAVTGPLIAILLTPLLLCCCCGAAAIGICQYVQRNRRRQATLIPQPQPVAVMQPMMPSGAPTADYNYATTATYPAPSDDKAAYPRQPMSYDSAVSGPAGYPVFQPPPPPAYPAQPV